MGITYIVRLNSTWYIVGFSLYLIHMFNFTPTLHCCKDYSKSKAEAFSIYTSTPLSWTLNCQTCLSSHGICCLASPTQFFSLSFLPPTFVLVVLFLQSSAYKGLYLLGFGVASITKSIVWMTQLGSTMCVKRQLICWVRAMYEDNRQWKNQAFISSSALLWGLDTLLSREASTPAWHLEVSTLSWSEVSKLLFCKQPLCHSFLQEHD